jgi:alanine dehydrogenase
VDGVVHYCVTNMPGAYARTSTFALTNVTLPYVLAIADLGWRQAARRNPELARGLALVDGEITHEPVARAHRLRYVPWSTLDKA